jgi:sulfatase maturation enzyme AslB (radical SAM superfamily)
MTTGVPEGTPQQASAFAPLQRSLGQRRLTAEPAIQFPLAIVNITNRCNLRCAYCFVYRQGNPNDPAGEMSPSQVLAEVERLRDRHGIWWAVWMGGEPMLRWRLLEKGVRLFQKNTVATNGTIPLKDFGPSVTYTISLDGPRELNDAARGAGVFDRVLTTVAKIPEAFESTVMVQCACTGRTSTDSRSSCSSSWRHACRGSRSASSSLARVRSPRTRGRASRSARRPWTSSGT